MTNRQIEQELIRIKELLVLQRGPDEWESPKKIAQRMGKSTSYVYKLIRQAKELTSKGKNGGIPFSEPTKGTILLCWRKVSGWLDQLQEKKQKENFED